MMTQEDKDKAVEDLRKWMEQVEADEEYVRMAAVLRHIRRWDPAGGEPMPDQLELEAWRRDLGMEPAAARRPDRAGNDGQEAARTVPSTQPLPQDPPPARPPAADSDDHLQPAFDRAQEKLAGGAFHAAMKDFEALGKQATGRLRRPAEEQMYAAQAALDRHKKPLLAAARNAAPDAADAAWIAVEVVDPDDPDAQAALNTLRSQAQTSRTQGRMVDMLKEVDLAFTSRRLPALNMLVGEAEGLRNANSAPELRLPLDDLVRVVTQRRDELRASLGSPSTLIATGNNREAYRQAKNFLAEKVPTIFDNAGIMGGQAGAEVDTYAFMRKVRDIYLAGLRKFADDRRAVAEGEQDTDPAAALETLEEVVSALTDDVLGNDDREELKTVRDEVDKDRRAVERRLQIFQQAQALVVAAAVPELPAEEKYQKLIEARETYQTYPGLKELLAAAESAVAVAVAAELEGEIAVARTALEGDQFDAATEVLKVARATATTKVESPVPGSPLAERLAEARTLEQDTIPARKAEYDRLVERLEAIDELLDAYVAQPDEGKLREARNRWTSLAAIGGERKIVDDRWQRLVTLEGVDTNWNEGRKAYDHGQWKEAIRQLEAVALSGHAARETAATMQARAEAAQKAEAGETAEKENRINDALTGYNDAVLAFGQHQPDAQTEAIRRRAVAGLERLKPYQEGDATVEGKLKTAGILLAQAKTTTETRAGSPSLLLPNPSYADAANLLLEAAQARRTTLAAQVEKALQEVRSLWEQAYSDGMLLARASDDPDVLRQGIALGEELEQHKLRTKIANRELLRSLRVAYLDGEYDRLAGVTTTKAQLLEENRRQRLSYTADADPKHADIEVQLAEAISARVKDVMAEKRLAAGVDGAAAARDYLSQEMIKPEVYGNKALFEEQMHLLWEEEQWDGARQEAENLRYRQLVGAMELRQLWLDLTDAAELMAANDFNGFEARMQALRKWFPAGGEQRAAESRGVARKLPVWFPDAARRESYLDEQEAALKRARVDKLIRLAAAALADGHQLKAAQYYAYARHWDSTHPIVVNGLKQVGGQLAAALNALDKRARGVAVQTNSLADSLTTAQDVWQQMVDIARVGVPLQLPTNQVSGLQNNAAALKNRIDGWERVKKILDDIQDDLQTALRNPQKLRDSGGGWNLESVVGRFSEANQEASNQTADKTALDMCISQQRQAVESLRDDANDLNEALRAFLDAFEQEEFDRVIDLIVRKDGLDQRWRDRQEDGFEGLGNLIIRRAYGQKVELTTLEAHRRAATAQRQDLAVWRAWADKAVAAHEALTTVADTLIEPLSELRAERSLVELNAACTQALELGTKFLAVVGKERPDGNPQSRAAELERDRVRESWSSDLRDSSQGTRRRVVDLQAQIQTDIATLAGKGQPYSPLKQLQAAMTQLEAAHAAVRAGQGNGRLGRKKLKTIPTNMINNAEKYLRECRALDPSNGDVVAANKRLNELKSLSNS